MTIIVGTLKEIGRSRIWRRVLQLKWGTEKDSSARKTLKRKERGGMKSRRKDWRLFIHRLG
jgi:hypothetical protein